MTLLQLVSFQNYFVVPQFFLNFGFNYSLLYRSDYYFLYYLFSQSCEIIHCHCVYRVPKRMTKPCRYNVFSPQYMHSALSVLATYYIPIQSNSKRVSINDFGPADHMIIWSALEGDTYWHCKVSCIAYANTYMYFYSVYYK